MSREFGARGKPVIKIIEIEGKEHVLYDCSRIIGYFLQRPRFLPHLKGMTQDLPLIVYLTGRGAPDITSKLRDGYDAISLIRPYIRASFINQDKVQIGVC